MQRNFIVFVILAISVITAWFWLASYYSTPPDQDQDQKKLAQGDKDGKAKGDTNKDDTKKVVQPKPEDKKSEPKKPDDKKDPDKKQDVKPPPQDKAATVTLGGEGFHLTADLTTRGAGVRRVVLNRFMAADWWGRRTDRLLELIQDDDISPPFRMYHFEDPADKNPVFGLGEMIWTHITKDKEIKDKDGNLAYHEATYTTTVPGLDHVRITKTYRLAPKDYHITLLLEFLDERKPGADPTMLRYQLTGGKGLPIEGEWYTATFRSSVIGMVDKGGDLWRKLEESARISPRKGGDMVPEKIGDSRL
jgi:hypothetical protein